MKKWGLRILLAFLTFTLGLCAVAVVRFPLAPQPAIPPASDVATSQLQLPPPQMTQDALSTTAMDEAVEVMQPHPVSISPYEIKRLIEANNLHARRQERHILELGLIWKQLGIEDGVILKGYKCNGDCGADIFPLELDGKPGKEIVLGIGIERNLEYRYLIFKRSALQHGSDETWILLGYADAYLRWSDPSHRVVRAGDQLWFVIGFVSGHGSAYGASAESWYEISENGVRQVLAYQTGLYWGMTHPTIDSNTKVLKVEHRDKVTTVILQSSTSYGYYERFDNLHHRLWTAERKATFIKGPGMREFSFDPLHSELTKEVFYSSEDDLITNKDFLKYNYRELARLAAKGNAKQKEWLRDYLKDCDETLEKKSLQIALGDGQP